MAVGGLRAAVVASLASYLCRGADGLSIKACATSQADAAADAAANFHMQAAPVAYQHVHFIPDNNANSYQHVQRTTFIPVNISNLGDDSGQAMLDSLTEADRRAQIQAERINRREARQCEGLCPLFAVPSISCGIAWCTTQAVRHIWTRNLESEEIRLERRLLIEEFIIQPVRNVFFGDAVAAAAAAPGAPPAPPPPPAPKGCDCNCCWPPPCNCSSPPSPPSPPSNSCCCCCIVNDHTSDAEVEYLYLSSSLSSGDIGRHSL